MQIHSLCVSPSSSFLFFWLPPFSLSSLFISHSGSQYCFLASCLPHFHFSRECAAFPPCLPSIFVILVIIFCYQVLGIFLADFATILYRCFINLLVIPVGGLTLPPLHFLSVCQETEKVVFKGEALGFINIPCLALYFYSAQYLDETLSVLWMLHWEWAVVFIVTGHYHVTKVILKLTITSLYLLHTGNVCLFLYPAVSHCFLQLFSTKSMPA